MSNELLHPRRHLNLEGAHNIRDLGGYLTSDGRRTRWGTFLRADSLHQLTPASQAALIEYGVRTVIDLRGTGELEVAPNVFAGRPEVAYRHQNMLGDNYDAPYFPETGDPADRFVVSYTGMLDSRQPQIRDTLATLADPGTGAAMYHCAGGKDRTGIVSALLLAIAGVPAATIAEDYGLTARYLVDRYQADPAPPEVSADDHTWQTYQAEFCPPEAMVRVLQHLDDRYGGGEGYVRTIGLSSAEIEAIRTAFVE